MDKYQRPVTRGPRMDRTPVRSSRTLWTAGLALVAVVLIISRLNGDASPVYPKVVIGLVVVVLVFRQWGRRAGNKGPRAAEPDPLSRLHLD